MAFGFNVFAIETGRGDDGDVVADGMGLHPGAISFVLGYFAVHEIEGIVVPG